MKCNKCGYNDSGSGDMAHVCQRPSFRYGEHPTSFGLFNPKQAPVAWMGAHDTTDLYHRKPPQADVVPLYTIPPPVGFAVMQKPWVGLTDEEMQAVVDKQPLVSSINVYFKAIEAKLKEKNT